MLTSMGKGRYQNGPAGTGREEAAFAERLRRLREAAGLTQEELALRAGLSPSAVGVLERGVRKRPYPHTVRALSEALVGHLPLSTWQILGVSGGQAVRGAVSVFCRDGFCYLAS
jgi:transcriptional regulator with XRE-family HTH domain